MKPACQATLRTALVVLLLVHVVIPAAAAAEPPRVLAGGETLEGAWEGDEGEIAAFKGIPFAAAPVGELRWRAPRANTPRAGVQQATEFAPACMQGPHLTDWYAGVAEAFGYSPDNVGRPNGVSEDCLYLNVWTPSTDPAAKLPVMVWMHGGSNVGGWSYEPNYIGDRLAARGVVSVSIAYRLGVFGFFSHAVLDNGPGEPVANFGWLDGDRAMRWIRASIGAFGGDPDNVTLLGESAGAGNIGDYIAGEMHGSGLYRRLVLQSSAGSLVARRTLAEEQEIGHRVVAQLGLEGEALSARQLRAVPAEALLSAAEAALEGHYFDVVVDGLTLKNAPLETYDGPGIAAVDILIGTNAHEWYMYLDDDSTTADVDTWLQDNAPDPAAVLRSKFEPDSDPRRALDRLVTARRMLCPSAYMAERISAAGGRAWVYYFSRQRPGPGGERLGAYHGTEIGYVFDRHEYWQTTDAVDRALTGRVMDYWVQFARTGDPNLPGAPPWPLYRAAQPTVLELGDTVSAVPQPDADLCLWLGPGREARK